MNKSKRSSILSSINETNTRNGGPTLIWCGFGLAIACLVFLTPRISITGYDRLIFYIQCVGIAAIIFAYMAIIGYCSTRQAFCRRAVIETSELDDKTRHAEPYYGVYRHYRKLMLNALIASVVLSIIFTFWQGAFLYRIDASLRPPYQTANAPSNTGPRQRAFPVHVKPSPKSREEELVEWHTDFPETKSDEPGNLPVDMRYNDGRWVRTMGYVFEHSNKKELGCFDGLFSDDGKEFYLTNSKGIWRVQISDGRVLKRIHLGKDFPCYRLAIAKNYLIGFRQRSSSICRKLVFLDRETLEPIRWAEMPPYTFQYAVSHDQTKMFAVSNHMMILIDPIAGKVLDVEEFWASNKNRDEVIAQALHSIDGEERCRTFFSPDDRHILIKSRHCVTQITLDGDKLGRMNVVARFPHDEYIRAEYKLVTEDSREMVEYRIKDYAAKYDIKTLQDMGRVIEFPFLGYFDPNRRQLVSISQGKYKTNDLSSDSPRPSNAFPDILTRGRTQDIEITPDGRQWLRLTKKLVSIYDSNISDEEKETPEWRSVDLGTLDIATTDLESKAIDLPLDMRWRSDESFELGDSKVLLEYGRPYQLAHSPDGHFIYLAAGRDKKPSTDGCFEGDYGDTYLFRIRTADWTVDRRWTFNSIDSLYADSDQIVVCDMIKKAVFRIDPEGNRPTQRIDLPVYDIDEFKKEVSYYWKKNLIHSIMLPKETFVYLQPYTRNDNYTFNEINLRTGKARSWFHSRKNPGSSFPRLYPTHHRSRFIVKHVVGFPRFYEWNKDEGPQSCEITFSKEKAHMLSEFRRCELFLTDDATFDWSGDKVYEMIDNDPFFAEHGYIKYLPLSNYYIRIKDSAGEIYTAGNDRKLAHRFMLSGDGGAIKIKADENFITIADDSGIHVLRLLNKTE